MVYLVDIAPRKLEMVRSDGGGEGLVPYVLENRLSRSLRLAIPQKSCGEDTSIRAVSERGFPRRRGYVGGTSQLGIQSIELRSNLGKHEIRIIFIQDVVRYHHKAHCSLPNRGTVRLGGKTS